MSSRKSPRLSMEEIAQRLKPIALRPLGENLLVSILTANYNYARFIGEAIESVQKQTYKNWELIVCDDGSTDNSCEIVERYMQRDSRIRLVTNRTVVKFQLRTRRTANVKGRSFASSTRTTVFFQKSSRELSKLSGLIPTAGLWDTEFRSQIRPGVNLPSRP